MTIGDASQKRLRRRFCEAPLIGVLRALFIAVFFILLIRVFFIEPFDVTTGSMAPFLLGVHRTCDCPKCGFPVVVGAPVDDSDEHHYADVRCPNCGQDHLGLEHQPDLPGDRIWVDKNVFEWRLPRRWELVVFRGPDDNATPFVKRVVGLPGESVQIKDGDVFVNGERCDRPYEVCKEMSFLIFDGGYPVAECWKLEGSVEETPTGLHFDCDRDNSAIARFKTPPIFGEGAATDYCVYNGAAVNRIERTCDFRLSCNVTMTSKSGFGRLSAVTDIVYFDPRPKSIGERIDGLIRNFHSFKFEPGRQHQFDVMLFDLFGTIAIDGRPFGSLDVPIRSNNFPVEIEIRDADVRIDNIRIYRDTHYQSDGRHGIRTPYRLGPDEIFVLGDNSAASDDSRFWPEAGVKLSSLIGKPSFLKPKP